MFGAGLGNFLVLSPLFTFAPDEVNTSAKPFLYPATLAISLQTSSYVKWWGTVTSQTLPDHARRKCGAESTLPGRAGCRTIASCSGLTRRARSRSPTATTGRPAEHFAPACPRSHRSSEGLPPPHHLLHRVVHHLVHHLALEEFVQLVAVEVVSEVVTAIAFAIPVYRDWVVDGPVRSWPLAAAPANRLTSS